MDVLLKEAYTHHIGAVMSKEYFQARTLSVRGPLSPKMTSNSTYIAPEKDSPRIRLRSD